MTTIRMISRFLDPVNWQGIQRVLLALVVLQFVPSVVANAQDAYKGKREQMVKDYIAAEGVTDPRVLLSMKSVPRHEFVSQIQRRLAYADTAMAIGYKQTISPPFIVAYMTQTIEPKATDRVLEIGTGSGYQAAVLSSLVKEVYTIEIVEPLGVSAAKRLQRLGYSNVHAKVGDGYLGWPEHAPFDKVIVTCSPEKVPVPLVEQLREGGKMIIPLGERYQQVFYLMEKRNGKLIEKKLIPTLFVPMTGASEDRREIRPDPLDPKIVNGSFEMDVNKDGRADNWHYQRQTILGDFNSPVGKRAICFRNQEVGRLSQALQGTAIDGRRLGKLKISLWARYEGTRPGTKRWETPACYVHFYDSVRKTIEDVRLGPFHGTSRWKRLTQTIEVPKDTREMIVRIGLNGGTGVLCIDGVEMNAISRD